MEDVECLGNETSLSLCSNDSTPNCNHREDAGVICSTSEEGGIVVSGSLIYSLFSDVTGVCSNGDIRLSGDRRSFLGVVEICFRNSWGTVCDDDWDRLDAKVVCNQLGYPEDERNGNQSFCIINYNLCHSYLQVLQLLWDGLIGCNITLVIA